jgi:hypothetical protein
MSYWQTVKEWNTLWYTLVWVFFCFPGLKTVGDFFGRIHRGDYSGAAGVVTAVILWLVLFYFIVAAFRYGYKVYTTPPRRN